MKTVGVIVEYNPLHNGHVYHLEQSRQITGADAVVAVMSGPFLQRGEPALLSKWARAEMALAAGIDLVLELPVAYSAQAAEWFAYGAVYTLDRIGVVDSLCFGSESGDIRWLTGLAKSLADESSGFQSLLNSHMSSGISYPAAYSRAIQEWLGESAHSPGQLTAPNNTLGLHYLIALQRLQSKITPYTVARHKSGFHDTSFSDRRIASATALRQKLIGDGDPAALRPYVPESTFSILQRELELGRAPIDWNRFMQPLLHTVVSQTEQQLEQIYEFSEGLEYRLKHTLRQFPAGHALTQGGAGSPSAFESWLDLLKTKRYTRTKLQRMLVRLLLGHRKNELSREALIAGPDYARVLAFSSKGRELLKRMRTESRLEPIVKLPRNRSLFLEMDIRAASVYALGYDVPTREDLLQDHYRPPIQSAAAGR
ncbi:nucleotidyltransferase [Paenibacillus senegalensis]|uniref:nucleotidyltransferase n=1 Tax=Paenibacillus senegalensis TaxID=1465766 RepID=UPI000288609D|nr:nucleotidyltransferase [Paenibacillus senegalensis]